MGEVIDMFPGWILVQDAEEVYAHKETRKDLILPGTSKPVVVCLGKYGNIPVELATVADSKHERTFMRAYGINCLNKRANAKRLTDLLKYREK